MSTLTSGRRYNGTLRAVLFDPLRLRVEMQEPDRIEEFSLGDVELKSETSAEEVLAALGPAIDNAVEIEVRDDSTVPPIADVWYPEPIVEDDEVEYTSPLHLRTVLLRARLIVT